MQKLSEKILAEIKNRKISPHARLLFLAKNYGVWALAIIAISLAAIFVGTFVAELLAAEWALLPHFPGGQINFVFHTLPIFWLGAILAAFLFAFFLLRRTKHGYRFGVLAITGGIFIASTAGGISLLSTPLPPQLHALRVQNFPPHFEEHEWMDPEEGFLFGEIFGIEEKLLILNAIDESVWSVDVSSAKIPSQLELVVGEKIRAVGTKLDDENFAADFILPAMPMGLGGMRLERKM